ncbi:S-adenosyl-L-methionine-dependent methyltransferase [Echria macrotheca]|uniref:S-adenosyl-L-methionine-dependent methyltransferase n=1 Tax=Echria macrotheca TaxID=438768 RepID=A0AAJ0BDY5_9PEZI|nr:S-adenosyl-L-methionine-dependent methyltransferase [Echria macrotheca]
MATNPEPEHATPATEAPAAPAPASAPANPILEPDANTGDQDSSDADSAFSAGLVSDTASISSSILKFREENGRTYSSFKASAYFMPNDEIEKERLDLQHTMMLLLQDNRLHLCPAGKDKPMRRVLDAGTGTGIWAMDFADENPDTAVVGVDISPIQPAFVPPNVEFFVDDLEEEWNYTRPFDLIRLSNMTGSIRDWPKFFAQSYRHLAPGGWIEIMDPINPPTSDDGTLTDKTALDKWGRLMSEAAAKLGSRLDSALGYEEQLAAAGFTGVVRTDYKWPSNTWPKDRLYKNIGAWNHENVLQGLHGFTVSLFTNVLGWSAAEVETFLIDVRKDLKNREIHAYWPARVIYAQKPL